MPTISHALAVAAVIGAAMLASACEVGRSSEAAPQPAPVAAPAPISWREIGSWSAKGSRQTESFEVSFSAMRVRWQTTNETKPGAGHFTVTLHSAVSGRPLQTLVDAKGVGSATVNIYDEPRWCYLVIDAANLEWTMTLEQGFAATTR